MSLLPTMYKIPIIMGCGLALSAMLTSQVQPQRSPYSPTIHRVLAAESTPVATPELVAAPPPSPSPTPFPVSKPVVKTAIKKTPAPVQPVVRTFVSSGNCEQYRGLVAQYSWDVTTAMAVMRAESGCNPNSQNLNDRHKDGRGKLICIGSFGLFQISCHGGKIFDPEQNVQAAWGKYQARGWKPWGAYTSGSYRKYLK